MAIRVNPPPRLRIPAELRKSALAVEYFTQLETILFQLWNRTGGETDLIAALSETTANSFNSQIQQIRKELDGLPEFTVDTTGFTTDLTFITTDKVIA